MEQIISLHNKKEIEAFLRKNASLNIYHIGDLDDFYWNFTQWTALRLGNEIKALFLLYTAVNPPVLLALSPPEELPDLINLLNKSLHLLPAKFYSHLTPSLEEVFISKYILDSHGHYQKMTLTDRSKIENNSKRVINLKPSDLTEIRILYEESYPENSFDPRMLETGMFFGIRENGKLVSIAGIHVYSPEYRVAALGNITTHPAYRGKGYGKTVTSALCGELLEKIDVIGLNVSRDNTPAINCYRRLGFTETAPYMEYMVEKNN